MSIVVNLTTNRTLGDLKVRIADEIARSDLTNQIALAIDDAITEAATHRFWFNEVRGFTFTIPQGQQSFGSDDIAALTEIDDLWLTIANQRRNIRVVNDDHINQLMNGNPITGEPYMWSRFGPYIRFYPVPQQDYLVTFDGSTRFPELAGDGDDNPWTTHGERYIRALVKRDLYANVIRDTDHAQVQDALAVRYRDELLSSTYDRVATGRMACNG